MLFSSLKKIKFYDKLFIMCAICACGSQPQKHAENNPTIADSISDNSKSYVNNSDGQWQKIERQNFSLPITVSGTIDVPPENKSFVSAYFSGYVKSIRLLPGQQVKKNQVLFVLENPDYVQIQKEFLTAKSELKYLQSDFERQHTLANDSVISSKKLLKSESDYKSILVRFEALRQQLLMMNINPDQLNETNMQSTIEVLSPLSGYVTDVRVNKGMFLNPSDVAVTIINVDHLHLELSILERDKADIKVGQAIKFKIPSSPEHEYDAEVYLINAFVDAEKRVINVHGHLKDESLNKLLTPGMFIEARIFTKNQLVLALPLEAVITQDEKNIAVLKVINNDGNFKYLIREIRTGLTSDKFVEVLNYKDFSENDVFLVGHVEEWINQNKVGE